MNKSAFRKLSLWRLSGSLPDGDRPTGCIANKRHAYHIRSGATLSASTMTTLPPCIERTGRFAISSFLKNTDPASSGPLIQS